MLAFGIHYEISPLSLIGLIGFIAAFALSSGNITWLYMAEISTEKGMGVGATVSWVLTLVISIFTQNIIDASSNISGKPGDLFLLFLVLSGITLLGAVFFFIFMEETLGKSA